MLRLREGVKLEELKRYGFVELETKLGVMYSGTTVGIKANGELFGLPNYNGQLSCEIFELTRDGLLTNSDEEVPNARLLAPCMFLSTTVTSFVKWVSGNKCHFGTRQGVSKYGYIKDSYVVVSNEVLDKYMEDTYGKTDEAAFDDPSDIVFQYWWKNNILRNNNGDPACKTRQVDGKMVSSIKIWIKI